MQGDERCQSKQTNKRPPRTTTQSTEGVCMERVSSMNGEVVYLSWETPGPGVSHVADDPPNSAHQHPNKEITERIRQTEWEGRHIPPHKTGDQQGPRNKIPASKFQIDTASAPQIDEGLRVHTYNLPQPTSSPDLSDLRTGSNI